MCPGWPLGGCESFDQPLVVAGGGVSLAGPPVTAPPHIPSVIAHVPPPALFAVSDGEVAAVAARSPTPVGQWVPRVTEDGPVEVYDLSGKLLLRAEMVGIVRDIAVSGRRLAVLLEVPDGRVRLEQFTIPNPSFVAATAVPRTATDLSISNAGVAYRVGTQIFFVRAGGLPTLVCRARATPIGLSIEGRRIAWAENVNGRGRIVALTAPTNAQVAASANEAAAPKRNGDILFGSIRVRNGPRLLYLMGPTGTHQRRLGTARNVWSPAWSPGGKWIAYGSTPRNGGLCPQLYVMRADGTHVRRLTHDRNCYLDPTWAPDGKRIAFDVWGGPATAGIWTMNLDGSGRRLVTDKGASPAWSPDGSTIAFRSKFPEAIWLMDADGSNLRQLTTPTDRPRARDDSDIEPAWSFNGKWIAFSRQHPVAREWQRDIFIVRSDGNGLRQLTSHVRQNTMPAWSPDGTRIAFVSDRAHRDLGDIYVMKADGAGQKRLTRNVDNQWPDWRARR
jgi:TolB protein